MKVLFLGPTTSSIANFLRDNGEEVIAYTDKLDPQKIGEIAPDFIVSSGYSYILKKDVLDLFPDKAVNLHISLLPWNRGSDPDLWSLLENSLKGVTIHYLDEGVDTGDIIVQDTVDLHKDDTLQTYIDRLQERIQQLFSLHWDSIKTETCNRIPQEGEGTTHLSVDKEKWTELLTDGERTPVSRILGLARK